MSAFKVRFEIAGGHVHCRLFVAKEPGMTYASCGTFVVDRGRQFIDLFRAFQHVEFDGDVQEAGKP